MKAVFVGGGSHRLIPILRGALAAPGLFDGGEICLVDLNLQRAEAVGRILQKTPEYAQAGCRITWTSSLETALPGADAVSVILMAGSPESFALGHVASRKHGFSSSDNISPNGALLGVKGAPILLKIARQMEKHCPQAWLLNFANPIAVLVAMVSRHTKIKALGLCQGFTNHQWDLNRILCGKDAPDTGFAVEAAGVNHLSFIVKGTYRGRNLFPLLDRALEKKKLNIAFRGVWSKKRKQQLQHSVDTILRAYRELGVVIFSTEPDGMLHLNYDEEFQAKKGELPATRIQALADVRQQKLKRQKADLAFNAHVDRDLPASFWKQQTAEFGPFGRDERDVFVRALRAIGGMEEAPIATSRLNEGAIEGLPDDVAVEYSQILFKNNIRAAGRYRVPWTVHGLISGLAIHQTLLADACALEDPKLLAHALLAYPVRAYSKDAKALYRDLIRINQDQIAAPLRCAVDYLK